MGTAASSATPFVAKTPFIKPLLLLGDKITAQPSTEYNAISLRPIIIERERDRIDIEKEEASQDSLKKSTCQSRGICRKPNPKPLFVETLDWSVCVHSL